MKEEGADTANTDKELVTSVLMPVLSCVTSFSPDLNEGFVNSAFLVVAPFLPRMKHFCVAWDQETNNAPYRAAAQAFAARDGDPQLELLQPMQRAACLILERIEKSLARANDQARASLVMFLRLYIDRIQHT